MRSGAAAAMRSRSVWISSWSVGSRASVSNVYWCQKAMLAWELELDAALVADVAAAEHVVRVAIAAATAVDDALVGGAHDADPCAIPPGRATEQRPATMPPGRVVTHMPGHDAPWPRRRPGRGISADRALLLAEVGGVGLGKLGQHDDDLWLKLRLAGVAVLGGRLAGREKGRVRHFEHLEEHLQSMCCMTQQSVKPHPTTAGHRHEA